MWWRPQAWQQSCLRAALPAVAPSRGLATFSTFGPHLASRLSAGQQRLDQVGVETDTQATVTSGAGVAAASVLGPRRGMASGRRGSVHRPRAGDARPGKNAAYCIVEMQEGSERRGAPGAGRVSQSNVSTLLFPRSLCTGSFSKSKSTHYLPKCLWSVSISEEVKIQVLVSNKVDIKPLVQAQAQGSGIKMPEFLRGSALGAGQIPSLRFDPLQPSAVPGGLSSSDTLGPWDGQTKVPPEQP